MKDSKGITLIALAVTVIILIIIASISITTLTSEDGTINETKETTSNAERESIIQKIQADLYTEKVKKGSMPTADELIDIITKQDYGTVNKAAAPGDNEITTTLGEYKIKFSEIIGWEN